MQTTNFEEVLEKIVAADQRYFKDAYYFVREALDYTQKQCAKSKTKEQRHVSGKQLLTGIRELSLEQFGPMAFMVFQEWGVHRCEDFGEIVFNMVEHSFLAKTETDSRADFQNGYDFYEVFRVPFLPAGKRIKTETPAPAPAGGLAAPPAKPPA